MNQFLVLREFFKRKYMATNGDELLFVTDKLSSLKVYSHTFDHFRRLPILCFSTASTKEPHGKKMVRKSSSA